MKMLQQNQTTEISLKNVQSKCGEIHFITNNLNIFCGFCQFYTESYKDFKSHFELLHFGDFLTTQKTSVEIVQDQKLSKQTLQNLKKVNVEYDDPLNWLCEKEYDITNDFYAEIPKISSKETNQAINETCSGKNDILHKNESIIEKVSSSILEMDEHEIDNKSSSTAEKDEEIEWSKPYEPRKSQIKRPYKPRDKQIACTYCARTFRRRAQLDNHQNIHTGEKPHQCECCGKRFRAVTTLQRHLTTHEKNKILEPCKFCNKLFSHKPALLSHTKAKHTQERTVSCDECEKRFYTANHCDTHKRRVHNKSNATLPTLAFACDICDNRYRSASMLSTHKFRKHFKTAKFTCEKCDKKFVDLLKLEQHQKIHEKESIEK